jgi:TrmH family RNA methyltransferase
MSAAIRIVLVEPSHPGNIGAAARAMKNMGLEELALVRPQCFPHADATARAAGAADLLLRARVVSTLGEAIGDCGLVVGTTARSREQHWSVLPPRAAATRIVAASRSSAVAILFGSERIGLTNDELACCQWLLRVPTNPAYDSLNLAMAVQIVAYEIQLARDAPPAAPERATPTATVRELQALYDHLAQVMTEVGFEDRTAAGVHLMSRLRHIFQRAELDQNEVNILRGLLTAVQGKRRRAGSGHRAT